MNNSDLLPQSDDGWFDWFVEQLSNAPAMTESERRAAKEKARQAGAVVLVSGGVGRKNTSE